MQTQARDAERAVLVGQLEVTGRGRPDWTPPTAVASLPKASCYGDGGRPDVIEQAPRRGGGMHQRRHQVLEHRAVPRGERHAVAGPHDRARQVEPVLVGDVALGDGEVAGEAGFGRQEVVVVGVDAVGTGVVADVEEALLAIEQEAEVHREGQRLGPRGDRRE